MQPTDGRSIMIVGNGTLDPDAAPIIDAADLVMRFNDCRSLGNGGSRTDIVVVCNTGRPAKRMLEEPGWRDNPAVITADTIWCVRDPEKFAAMRAPLAVSHPELDDFCDDYTEGFAAFARTEGKAFHVVPAATHDHVDDNLAAFQPPAYVCPSTGLVAVAEFLTHFSAPGDRVSLAGFGHQGWEWHPWEAERRWVDHLVAQKQLQRLNYLKPKICASGA